MLQEQVIFFHIYLFWVVGCWRGYPFGAMCRLAYGPVDATATQGLLLQ